MSYRSSILMAYPVAVFTSSIQLISNYVLLVRHILQGFFTSQPFHVLPVSHRHGYQSASSSSAVRPVTLQRTLPRALLLVTVVTTPATTTTVTTTPAANTPAAVTTTTISTATTTYHHEHQNNKLSPLKPFINITTPTITKNILSPSPLPLPQ